MAAKFYPAFLFPLGKIKTDNAQMHYQGAFFVGGGGVRGGERGEGHAKGVGTEFNQPEFQ